MVTSAWPRVRWLRVHPGLDDLDGNFAPNGLQLISDPDFTHATFADEVK